MKYVLRLLTMAFISIQASASANICNYGFGKPEKKMKDGKEVASLSNKGQMIIVNDGKLNVLLVTDKSKDKVQVIADGREIATTRVSGFVTTVNAAPLSNAKHVIIVTTKLANKPGEENSVKQYTMINPDISSMSDKGKQIIQEQTKKCSFYLQAFFPPLDQLPLSDNEKDLE